MPGLCRSVSSQSRAEAAPYATGSSNKTQGAGENQASLLNPKRFNNPQLKAGVGLVSFYCSGFSPVPGKSSVVRVFLKGAPPCTRHPEVPCPAGGPGNARPLSAASRKSNPAPRVQLLLQSPIRRQQRYGSALKQMTFRHFGFGKMFTRMVCSSVQEGSRRSLTSPGAWQQTPTACARQTNGQAKDHLLTRSVFPHI